MRRMTAAFAARADRIGFRPRQVVTLRQGVPGTSGGSYGAHELPGRLYYEATLDEGWVVTDRSPGRQSE